MPVINHPMREPVTNDFLFHPLQRMEGKGNHVVTPLIMTSEHSFFLLSQPWPTKRNQVKVGQEKVERRKKESVLEV